MSARLGVNIDHIATVREARGTNYPDPVHAAVMAELGGADQITVHLREDRRHIQDRDVRILKSMISVPLNLEMAATEQMLEIALQINPSMVTLVPENREEKTTEGGLNIESHFDRVSQIVKQLQKKHIEVSLFIAPNQKSIDLTKETSAQAIEIHTGFYADARNKTDSLAELERIKVAADYAEKKGLNVYAGHGLHYRNILPLLQIKQIKEYNIGHSIVGQALYVGMERAVREMKMVLGAG